MRTRLTGILIAHAFKHLSGKQREGCSEHVPHETLPSDGRRGQVAVGIRGVVVYGQENMVDPQDDQD